MNALRKFAGVAAAGLALVGASVLTLPAARAEAPAQGREGSDLRLLFTRQVDNQDNLYVLALAGGEARPLTRHRAKDSHGVVSRDGARIVFSSERVGWWKIWSMNADGSDIRQVTSPRSGADYYPDWSPDGTRIAYASGALGHGDIVTMAADGSGLVNLTDHPAQDNFPAWSPDGNRIAFASDRGDGWGVYVMDADGGNLRRVSAAGQAIEPAWFPGSRRLAFQSDAEGSFDLYVVELAEGSTPRRLTSHAGNEKRPAISPDGRYIAFESDRDGGSQIFVMPADGGDSRRLTDEGYNFGPAWFPLTP